MKLASLVVVLAWDSAAWTQNDAVFFAQLKAAEFGEKALPGCVIALSGDAWPMVQQKLTDAGSTLAARLALGPLQ